MKSRDELTQELADMQTKNKELTTKILKLNSNKIHLYKDIEEENNERKKEIKKMEDELDE